MLHELFITHCTNSTLIMNPSTCIKDNSVVMQTPEGKTAKMQQDKCVVKGSKTSNPHTNTPITSKLHTRSCGSPSNMTHSRRTVKPV